MPRLDLSSDAFHLGNLVVAPSLNRIVREGRACDVEPRVMRVLVTLAEKPGEVVTRAELFEAVWPETVVGDEALTRAVSELRKTLGDDAFDAVETIRGTGYRLAVPVHPLAPRKADSEGGEPTALPQAPPKRGSLVFLALVLAAVSLAVAVWAAWPRVTLGPSADTTPQAVPNSATTDTTVLGLDSTSSYYRPGMSDMGVYYDSTTSRYFRFEKPPTTE